MNPVCAACGGKKKLEVHHIIPFQIRPGLELASSNLITLCEAKRTINCHIIVGHGGDYKDVNPYVRETAQFMKWLLTGKQFIKGGVYRSDSRTHKHIADFVRDLH